MLRARTRATAPATTQPMANPTITRSDRGHRSGESGPPGSAAAGRVSSTDTCSSAGGTAHHLPLGRTVRLDLKPTVIGFTGVHIREEPNRLPAADQTASEENRRKTRRTDVLPGFAPAPDPFVAVPGEWSAGHRDQETLSAGSHPHLGVADNRPRTSGERSWVLAVDVVRDPAQNIGIGDVPLVAPPGEEKSAPHGVGESVTERLGIRRGRRPGIGNPHRLSRPLIVRACE